MAVEYFRKGCSYLVSLMKLNFKENISEKGRSITKNVDASQQHHHHQQKHKAIKAIETATTSSTKTSITNLPEDVLAEVKSMENNTIDNYLPQQQLQQEMYTKPTTILYKTTINDLPEDVLSEILSRFPTTIAVQCKSVSKHWKTVLSSYNYALSFDKHYDAPCWEFAVVKKQQAYLVEDKLGKLKLMLRFIFSLYYSNLDIQIKLDATHDPKDFAEHCLRKYGHISFHFIPVLCATHNGLLLFDITGTSVKFCPRTLYICNPLTNQCVTLPPFNPEELGESTYSFGLICRRSNNKKNGELETRYRVLGVPLESESNMVQIFSSEIGQWSHSFMSSSMDCFKLLPGKKFVYKQMIFWSKMSGGFVGFDPFNIDDHGCCPTCIIDLPNYRHFFMLDYNPTYYCGWFGWMSSEIRGAVGVCQGKLRVSRVINRYKEGEYEPKRYNGYPNLEVLELQEEDNKENLSRSNKWLMVHVVDLDSIVSTPTQSIRRYIKEREEVRAEVLAFHPIDGDIVVLWLNDFILFCNMRKKTMDIVEDLRDQRIRIDLDCLGKCLWLPSWPYPIIPPEELLADILRRLSLSPKASLRCKCVSNRWKTIISRYDFAQYIDRIHAQNLELALIKTAYLRKDRLKPKINLILNLSLCYSYLQYSIELPLPRSFHFSSDLKPYLCATHNGLLLFDLADYRRFGCLHGFYLCNPLTKQWITIPSVDLTDGRNGNGNGHSYGFICKRRRNEINGELETRFRVLSVPLESQTNKFKVFSSDTGQWSQFHSVAPFLLSGRSPKNFVYKGMIYWRKLDGGFVGFDPFEINDLGYCSTRIIEEPNNSNIPGLAVLPRSFVANSPGLKILLRNDIGLTSSEVLDTVGVSQGSLRMSQLFGSDRVRPEWYPILRVWELNDDEEYEKQTGSGSKWWLVHEVDINEIACQRRLFPPHVEDDVCAVVLGFHPNDSDIVVMWLNEFIVFCNLQKRTMKIVDVLREERQKIDYDCLSKCCWFPCWPYPVTAPPEPF